MIEAFGPPARVMMRCQILSLWRFPPTMTRCPFSGPMKVVFVPLQGRVIGVAMLVMARMAAVKRFVNNILQQCPNLFTKGAYMSFICDMVDVSSVFAKPGT
jgi:hypothetical protein